MSLFTRKSVDPNPGGLEGWAGVESNCSVGRAFGHGRGDSRAGRGLVMGAL